MLQEELQERDIESWAGEDFSAAQALADEADGIYRQRKFMQALEKYRESLAAFQQLRDSIPERIEQHLAEGHQALNSGDAESAHKAFDLVLTISDEHPRGIKGKARAEKLPEAWQHFTSGKKAYSGNDLDAAREALQQSLSVDPETQAARELLPEVLAAITERDYSQAMSAGYAAIAAENFTSAQEAFKRAQKLKPAAGEPQIGLQQAINGIEQHRIDQLFSRARQQEESEDWHGAVKSYTKLVEKDASLVSAITGKARAEARAQLDDQLQALLDDPLTLGNSKRNRYARGVLADARQINSGTPRLQQQIEGLENALTRALIPLPVRLRSDSSTSVTIYHVGRLGNFDQREITLKPGRYTAVGTREGYRDVRREFTVAPGEEPPTVVIQCAEKINGVNNT
ncbi:tetratricopeptide repeat protein [Microbulbifer taiwanensis]|uniref:tetratricopeptide repeat protein n=1 Tax=Microbulbifer taiwanensis TaxID=986746 RepID=UPI00361C5FDF